MEECMFIFAKTSFKARNDTDFLNDEIETSSIENVFFPVIQRPTRAAKTTSTITDTILENKMDPGIIKTYISDYFSIFTMLKTYNYNSLEKRKIINHVITEDNTFWFLISNVIWDSIVWNPSFLRG